MYEFNEKVYPYSTSLTMGNVGGKWKAVILYNLKPNALRYNELRKTLPTVTESTLSLQSKNWKKLASSSGKFTPQNQHLKLNTL